MTELERDIIGAVLGTLMGDGYLGGNFLYVCHSDKQKSYVEYKKQLFDKMGLYTTEIITKDNNTNVGIFKKCVMKVRIPANIVDILKTIYVDKKKVVKLNLLMEYMTPLGIILWWMDDGCLSIQKRYYSDSKYSVGRRFFLNTQGFGLDGCKLIQEFIKLKYNINTRLHQDNNTSTNKINPNGRYFKLYFSATETRKFIDVVRPHINDVPSTMKYKFNMQYTPNKLKDSVYNTLMYNF